MLKKYLWWLYQPRNQEFSEKLGFKVRSCKTKRKKRLFFSSFREVWLNMNLTELIGALFIFKSGSKSYEFLWTDEIKRKWPAGENKVPRTSHQWSNQEGDPAAVLSDPHNYFWNLLPVKYLSISNSSL